MTTSQQQQRLAVKQFIKDWTGKGYEKGESQPFWLQLLGEVLQVEHPSQFIRFENQVMLDHTSFIDGIIASTHVLIEQKSLDKNLNQPVKQSDGSLLTPFQQAKRYASELPYSQRPRWIVTCNFAQFYIYDMEKPFGEPEIVYLKDLERDYYRLQFLVDSKNKHIEQEMQVSVAAGAIVGRLYDALLAQYKDATNTRSLQSLNMLCVRLVFCLYAEDAGIFGRKNMFHDYLQPYAAKDLRRALIDLFKVLDETAAERDPYLDDELAAFPYVNGGLFADEDIEIPQLTDEIKELLLLQASENFDWSKISPTIFGAVFESTLNPATRRSGGMHYTSIENIHKVIDPLFLDALHDEFAAIREQKQAAAKKKALQAFQQRLAGLVFLDPACGSGNFLTETYISLRKLENDVLKELLGAQIVMGNLDNPVQVSISQFYGIEINDFAVTVAKTALWIAESQMLKETEDIVNMSIDFLPLKTNAYITEGNALRLDWESVVPKAKLDYIMGNPPFVGMKYQNASQKADMSKVMQDISGYGYLDYVCAWYVKAAEYMEGTNIVAAYVSTNSIIQGSQAFILWKPLMSKGIEITFAYQPFVWSSEASQRAAVHCVIIGFSYKKITSKLLYQSNTALKVANNINAYLTDADNFFIANRRTPICNVPKIIAGNKPVDGNFLKIEASEYDSFISKEPRAKKFIKRLIGGEEFINNKLRYVLWLVNASPAEIKSMPNVLERVRCCKEARLQMKDAGARKLADTPTTFRDTLNPEQYLVIPIVSSENRKYIPIGFLNSETIPTNQVQIIPGAGLYELGILTSNVHMAWMRAVAGRLEMRYRYSGGVVYNNFPWPTPTPAQRARIERTAQAILDARALYADSSLADLYDELTMPTELRDAHRANDRAVMDAYGLDVKTTTESTCVAYLMKLYQKLC